MSAPKYQKRIRPGAKHTVFVPRNSIHNLTPPRNRRLLRQRECIARFLSRSTKLVCPRLVTRRVNGRWWWVGIRWIWSSSRVNWWYGRVYWGYCYRGGPGQCGQWCPFEKSIPGAVLRTRVFIPEPDPKKIAMIRKEALRPFVAGSGDHHQLLSNPDFSLAEDWGIPV